jgi:hypothetical protein
LATNGRNSRAPAGYRTAEIRRDDPLSAQIPQQDAQRTGATLLPTGLNVRRAVDQESVHDRRRECSQIGDPFGPEKSFEDP